jgi:hypothetical protein
MDPVTAAGVLAKILVAGLTARIGARTAELDADDLSAIEKFLEVGLGAAGALRGAGGSGSASMEALHFALVTRAFGAALRDHWHDDARLAPVLAKVPGYRALFRSKSDPERNKEAAERLGFALVTLKKIQDDGPSDALGRVRAVVEHPLTTPYYRALWHAFTHATLDESEATPLVLFERPENKLAFEGTFLLAHAEEMAGAAAEKLRNHLVALQESEPRILRRLLLQDMATWDRRHVFGDGETPGIPFLPRRDIYVEPNAVFERGPNDHITRPVQAMIDELLKKHAVVIVRGDFGLGKSMTARLLACRLAQQYLTNRDSPSSELPFPVFVKCNRDIRPRDQTLKASAKWAFFEQARERGISIQESHSALALPAPPERVIYFVDGLDEVQWSDRDLEDFFRSLKGETDHRQQAIVFSRKAVVPAEEKRQTMPAIDVQPFTTRNANGASGGQVAAWIQKWNRLEPDILEGKKAPVTVEQLAKRGLLDVCATPIVLLMAAATWEGDGKGQTTRAQIYERFVKQVARGKYERDQETHSVVARAADELKAHLVKGGELEDTASSPDAMLWLMARTAWEGQKVAAKHKELTVRHVQNLLSDELEIDDPGKAELVKMGLLLVLQAELATGNHRISYQHKSFREFLVARYWATVLWRLTEPGAERRPFEERLLGARLFAPEDESFHFLLLILHATPWDDGRREALLRWADARFHDESPHFEHKTKPSWSADQTPALREAALAIAGALKVKAGDEAPRGVEVRDPEALRSLVAWSWMKRLGPGLQAPAVAARGIDLTSALLQDSHLSSASLQGAILEGANLVFANLVRTNLEVANLRAANLRGAFLPEANLQGANLQGASLHGAFLHGANLRAANLRAAKLQAAFLPGANLQGADLQEADLQGANLRGASATLKDMNLVPRTRWPEGFDPTAAGVSFIDAQPEPNEVTPPTEGNVSSE